MIAICMQSAAAMTLGKPFFVLKICLRQLRGLPKYFPKNFWELEIVLSVSYKNFKPKSDLGTVENRAPDLQHTHTTRHLIIHYIYTISSPITIFSGL